MKKPINFHDFLESKQVSFIKEEGSIMCKLKVQLHIMKDKLLKAINMKIDLPSNQMHQPPSHDCLKLIIDAALYGVGCLTG